MGKGARNERNLVKELEENGIPAFRFPASGGGTKRELPDLQIRGRSDILAAEHKTCGGDYGYVQSDEIEKLKTFAKKWGFLPVALFKFDYDTTRYAVVLDGSEELTNGGNLSMKKAERKEYRTLSSFC